MNATKVIFKRITSVFGALVVMLSCFLMDVSGIGIHAEAAEGMTNNQIIQGAEGLFNQLLEYSVSDSDKFAELYIGATEEEIQADQEVFAEIYEQNYENQYFGVVVNEEPYFRIIALCYTVTNNDDDIISSTAKYFKVSFKDGHWKRDFSDESDILDSEENLNAIFPADYLAADYRGENNICDFQSSFCYLDDDFTYKGALVAEVLYAWQNEDGSGDVIVGMSNGTNNTEYITEFSFTITNPVSGQLIIDKAITCNEIVKPGCNKTITVHLEPSDVLTGTDLWYSEEDPCLTSHNHWEY